MNLKKIVMQKQYKVGKDSSTKMLEKYFSLTNCDVEVLLKNGRMIKGVIIGFYSNDEELEEPAVHHWHIIDQNDKIAFGFDPFGLIKGEIVKHSEIASIYFHEDNSRMDFSQ